MSKVIKNQNLQTAEINSNEGHIFTEDSFIGDKYNPSGYNPNKKMLEKRLFSTPEYFVYETRFGIWIANKLFTMLSILNRYSLNKISKTTSGNVRTIIEYLTDLLSNSLTWINHFRSRKQIEEDKRE